MYPSIQQSLKKASDIPIDVKRVELFNPLIEILQKKLKFNEQINLNFICTHNSRRSQFAQIWMTVLAHEYNFPIRSFSSGTEETALNERVVTSLKRNGFQVSSSNSNDPNPTYNVRFDEQVDPVVMYSKKVEEAVPENESFIAVLTCSDAEANCPFIPEAEARIPLKYQDPKPFDGTEDEAKMYDLRSLQIASELLFIIQKLVNHGNI